MHTLDIAPLRSEWNTTAEALRSQVWHVFSRDFTVLPAHPYVHPQSEWAIPVLPSQPQLVLIYRPRRDGRLSRPWTYSSFADVFRDSTVQLNRLRTLYVGTVYLYVIRCWTGNQYQPHSCLLIRQRRHNVFRTLRWYIVCITPQLSWTRFNGAACGCILDLVDLKYRDNVLVANITRRTYWRRASIQDGQAFARNATSAWWRHCSETVSAVTFC